MFQSLLSVLGVFWLLLKYPVYFVFFCIALFFLFVTFFIFIDLIKGRRFQKSKLGRHKKYKKPSILRRLVIDLPRQVKDDLFNKNPDFFNPQGLIIFEGKQGAGKTVAMVEYALRLQKMYPLSLCMSNFNFTKERFAIKHWMDFIKITNGIYGIIIMLDELQNWFSSNDSRNFPPEMLDTISQNRKNRRTILRYYAEFSSAR